MNKKVLIGIIAGVVVLVGIIITMIVLNNNPAAPATPTTNPDMIYTAAAQTADARLTEIFASTPSATPVTPTPTFDAAQTMAAQTASAVLTLSPSLTPVLSPTSATTPVPTIPSGPSADRAIYVADVTIPDGTVISPGAAFTKTWKLQNAGSTTWTTSYSLAFVSGEKMGTISSVPLMQAVAPGAQIDISVDLVAPTTPGRYQGYWKLKNSAGQFFNDSVYVLITVGTGGGATPTATSGTPGATPIPTQTGVPGDPITSLTMSVDPTSANDCNHQFTFTAWVTVNQNTTLTYKLEAGSDTGYTFILPNPVTTAFNTGSTSVVYNMTFVGAGSGWVSFHVTSPVDKSSNQATFTLTCGTPSP
jgi:hypothetical protein